MKVLCIVLLMIHVTLGENRVSRLFHRRKRPTENMEDAFSNISHKLYYKKTECDKYYVEEQYAGEGAEEAQEKMEKRYRDCMQEVESQTKYYLAQRARHDGKTIKDWLSKKSNEVNSENKEVTYDKDKGYSVRVNGPRYAQTYVQAPEEYNPGYKPPERRPLRLHPLKKYSESEPPKRNVLRKPLDAVKAVFARVTQAFACFKNLFWK